MTFAASMMLALAMLVAPDMAAQTRRGSSSGSSSTTRSSGSSTTRSSGSSSTRSSGSTVRSSGSSSTRSSSVQQDNRRSSGSSSATRSSGSSSTRSSGSTVRSSGSSSTQSSGSTVRSSGSSSTRSSGSTVRSSGSSSATRSSSGATVRSSGTTRSSVEGTTTRAAQGATVQPQPQERSSATVRSSNVSRSGLSGTAVSDPARQEIYRDAGYNYRYHDDFRVDDRHNMYRVPPRQRDPMAWDRPGHFWGDHPHYYGYRIHALPPSWRRISHWGMDYYYYNGIYYRPYGGDYVVCRPPFGTPLEAAIDRAILRTLRFAYYYDTYRTYESVFDYYNVIARQNLIIAQQNARLIARNSSYAINSNRALSAYELANRLGLVQSYAYANADYFYQDGVFYTVSASGVYTTIVPPAGALVTSLPDDYEIIVMGGIEYYLVDNTVFRTTVFEGEPYLEVLGQMYGNLYNQYNVYR